MVIHYYNKTRNYHFDQRLPCANSNVQRPSQDFAKTEQDVLRTSQVRARQFYTKRTIGIKFIAKQRFVSFAQKSNKLILSKLA